ncbi:MAG: hypothetical protein OXI25_02010 [Chloroflexota bacterium]|nr:hypothetical protein [Chloroflexota bacterium]
MNLGRFRKPLRHVVLGMLVVSMPLLYAAAVTLDHAGLTMGAVAFTAAACALAAAVY